MLRANDISPFFIDSFKNYHTLYSKQANWYMNNFDFDSLVANDNFEGFALPARWHDILGNLFPDSWFEGMRSNFGETLSDDMIIESVHQASVFFNMDDPMAVQEDYAIGVYNQLPFTPIDDIVVFNKPAGLAVQGGTGIRKSVDKMAAALFPYDKVSLVHRLDKETSGVLVVAKNQRAAQNLAVQFQNKTAHKEYLALLNGDVNPASGVIDNFMLKGQVFDAPTRLNNGTGSRPQRAITDYKGLSNATSTLSWVQFSPKTGRTHQLRLHSAFSLNAPIVGDDLYGRRQNVDSVLQSMLATNNLFLFAYKITFQHPSSGRMMTLRATVPDFMLPIMKFLEFKMP